jgi:phosphoserine phosphatase
MERWSRESGHRRLRRAGDEVRRAGVRARSRAYRGLRHGTLWCEQPLQVQVFFALDRLKALAAKDPTMKDRQPYKAFLEHDLKTIHELGKKAVFEVALATHARMTEDEFDRAARGWLASARHPKLRRLFTQCVYQPQLELLDYLRANGLKTFIVSGGGVDLMRAFAEEVYGIPPEEVIGSSVKTRFEVRDGRGVLLKLAELGSFDDREVKPQNIQLHIGRRPILAFGNSDGDLAMLRYVKSGDGPRLALLLHHDDAGARVRVRPRFHTEPARRGPRPRRRVRNHRYEHEARLEEDFPGRVARAAGPHDGAGQPKFQVFAGVNLQVPVRK